MENRLVVAELQEAVAPVVRAHPRRTDAAERQIFLGDMDAAVEPIDATFRRRDALSQVSGLLRLEYPQERAFGRFQADIGGRVHCEGPPSGPKAHLIIVNNAWAARTRKRTPFVLNGSFELFGLDSSSKRAPGRCDAVGGL